MVFSVLIFWHYFGRGFINNAFDAKILHPTTTYVLMVSFIIGGAWGRLWFVHKWGETANFISHFFTLLDTKTSFLACF